MNPDTFRPPRTLCVFCGARTGRDPRYAEAARQLGHELGRRGLGLVFGGGRIGLMGVLADAALSSGVSPIGVIPDKLVEMEQAHSGLYDLRVVRTMHERKALMYELADGFVALPGGIGTFEELCEALTWSSIGYHAKPVGLLDTAGYFAPLLAMLDHAVGEGFLSPGLRAGLIIESEPAQLLERIAGALLPLPAAAP